MALTFPWLYYIRSSYKIKICTYLSNQFMNTEVEPNCIQWKRVKTPNFNLLVHRLTIGIFHLYQQSVPIQEVVVIRNNTRMVEHR